MTGREDEDDGIELTGEQKKVLDLDKSISVTAGAGTGKTLVLTERYVRALEEPGVSPENIVTITFTKKATNEMEERIREEVIDRLAEAGGKKEYQEWRKILEEFEESYIHTIHGFCSRLLREYAVEAPVVPGFDVVEGVERDTLQQEAVESVLDTSEMTDGEQRAVRELSEIWGRDKLSGVLRGMLDPDAVGWAKGWENKKGDEYLDRMWELCDLPAETALGVTTSQEFEEAVSDMREVFKDGFSLPEGHKAESAVENLRKISEHSAALDPNGTLNRESLNLLVLTYQTFEKNSGGLYSGMGYVLGGKSKWDGMENEYDILRPAAETLLELVEPHEDSLQMIPDAADENAAEYIPHLATLTLRADEEYNTLKEDRNSLDYDDLIDTTIRFLRSNDAMRRQISDGFSHVMVDEFQDTDPRQWELVKLLTGHGEDDYGSDSVFLVGDEKQSIYGFRGADVTSFGRARKELKGEDREVSGNFRTLKTPLDFVNSLFEGVFEPLGAGYEEYEAKPQTLSMERDRAEDIDDIEGSIEYHIIPDEVDAAAEVSGEIPAGFEDADSSGEREAEAVGAKVAGVLNEDYTVYDEDEEEMLSAGPKDIAVLLRRRTHLKKYERALENRNVPYTVVSGVGFYDTPEVEYLVNLLRALSDPTDDISLYGVLRSPIFGFTDDELALVAEDGDIWESLENIKSDGRDKELRTAYESLSRWRKLIGFDGSSDEESGSVSWDRLITRVIDETGYLASVSAGDRGRQAQANIEKFRQQLRAWSDSGVRTPSELLRRLRLQQEDEDQGEATIPSDAEGVRILTIHSAKGLEFPIVVVPDLDGGINFENTIENEVVLGEIEDIPTVGMKAPTGDRYERRENLAWRRIEERNKATTRAEEKRVLYVACTRTRDHLVLCSQHEIKMEEDAGLTFGDVEDDDEAKCWRDWVQPIVLDDSVAEELAEESVTSVTRRLGNAEYTVSVPTRSPEYERDPEGVSYPPKLDVPQPSHSPKQLLYATQLLDEHIDDESSAGSDSGEGADVEDRSRTIVEGTDAESEVSEDGIPSTLFGTIVHKICELDPPEDEWREYIRKTAGTKDYSPTEEEMDEILEHTDKGVKYARRAAEGEDVVSSHDEIYVTADLENARISGEVDRLVVKEDGYHIIDYKTNSLSWTSPDELLEHYRPQMLTYATAIRQSYPNRDIEATLVFTETGDTRSISWSSEDDISAELSEVLGEVGNIPGLL